MKSLFDIHEVALIELKKKFSLKPVALKHPLPERPVRTLGLVKIDGEVFSSEKLARVVLLKINFPVYLTVRSMFIRPPMELDLPVFATEIMLRGKKRMFIVDIHRTGENMDHDDSALFDRLIAIRARYPDLLQKATTAKGEIQTVFSKAACQTNITAEHDEQAINIFREYLEVFMEIVEKATPLSGDILEKAKGAYEVYLKKIVDHDPGMRGYKLLFGKKGGIERSLNMHFEQ
jgi:hypothetical protein